MHIYIYMYIHMYTFIHTYIYICIYIRTCVLLCVAIQKTSINVGLCISRTNAYSQWNLFDKAFHRIYHCGNETIRW